MDGPWKTLGEMLRELREEKGMNLREVSLAINVDYKKLERMEQGDFKNLDVPIYVKGYLRRYADILGVDSDELIKLYEQGFETVSTEVEVEKKEEKKWDFSIVLIIVILIINLALFYVGFKELSFLLKEPPGVIENLSGDVIKVNNNTLKPGERMALKEGVYKVEGNKGDVIVRTKGKIWKVKLENFEVRISWEK